MASVRTIIEHMSQTDIRRSIVVSDIPPETSEAALTIHFQRRKYGGGDVLSINILQDSRHDGATAIVTFEAAESKLKTEDRSLYFVEFRKVFV